VTLIWLIGMTHWLTWLIGKTHSWAWFIGMTHLLSKFDMTRWHDTFVDMTHWHDSSIDMNYWHDSFPSDMARWLICMTHSYEWVTYEWLHMWPFIDLRAHVTWGHDAEPRWHVTWLHDACDLFAHNVTTWRVQQCDIMTWLMQHVNATWRRDSSNVTWRHDSGMHHDSCNKWHTDLTDLYVTRHIHLWHDSSICDMAEWCAPYMPVQRIAPGRATNGKIQLYTHTTS